MTALARFTATTLAAFAVTGCVTMNVATHLDRTANFAQYRTWDWGEADQFPTGDPRLDNNTFFIDHIEGAMEKALTARGFVRTERGGTPDLRLHYHASINQRLQINEADVNCAPGNCQASVIEYEQGTLVVDMIDTRTQKLVWRGWAQDSVQGVLDNQDRMEKQIDEAVTKMMAAFPRVN